MNRSSNPLSASRPLIVGLAASVALAGAASAEFTGLGATIGSATVDGTALDVYRLYATFDSADDQALAVSSTGFGDLTILSSDSGFYQLTAFGSHVNFPATVVHVEAMPAFAHDSFLTIGIPAGYTGSPTLPTSAHLNFEDFNPVGTGFGSPEVVMDGIWNAIPSAPDNYARPFPPANEAAPSGDGTYDLVTAPEEATHGVLIGQFSVGQGSPFWGEIGRLTVILGGGDHQNHGALMFSYEYPARACCLPNGSCQMAQEQECQALGGSYADANVDCASVTCSTSSCPADLDDNGEVNFGDMLQIIAGWGACPAASVESEFAGHVIANANAPQMALPVDLDGDGDLDVLACSHNDSRVRWYERTGAASPQFTAHEIDLVNSARAVAVADMDDDGDLDAIAGGVAIRWYENDGAATPSFTTHVIAPVFAVHIEVADMNGDGAPDVLSSAGFLRLYLSDGNPSPTLLGGAMISPYDAHEFSVADLDDDGDLDIIMSDQADDVLAWLENDGAQAPSFAAHVIDTLDYPLSADVADVDGDGDLDLLYGGEYEAAWYENNGAPSPAFSKHQVIASDEAIRVMGIHAADLDVDGDTDIVMSRAWMDDILWYENDGISETPGFTQRTVSTGGVFPHSVRSADVDGDGDLDVIATDAHQDTISWHENHVVEPCPFDLNGDGEISFADLMTTIMQWGPCP
ncbi:MAG: VCBS repeat-containing protein [Planctomycetes bacterium]|nr:VCBS repeat-containing protein [Planctomycetota bacterium]